MKVFLTFLALFLSTFSSLNAEVNLNFIQNDKLQLLSKKELLDLYNSNSPFLNGESGNYEYSKEIIEELLKKSLANKDSLFIGKAYFILARLNNNSIDLFDEAIKYTKDLKDKVHPCISYLWKFEKYYINGDYRKAYNVLWHADTDLSEFQKELFYSDLRRYLNMLNIEWGNKELGLKKILQDYQDYKLNYDVEKSEVIYSETERNEIFISYLYRIARVYYDLNQYEISISYLDSLKYYGDRFEMLETIDNVSGLKGAILYKQGEYQEALSYTNEYLNNHIPNDAYGISRSSVIKGLTLWELNRQEEAVASLIKADSLYQHTKDEFEELGDGYKTLITYYKNKDNTDKQLEYLNKLLEFDEEITANYLEIAPAITRSYTIPELLSEKEQVIRSLNKKNQIAETKKTVYYSLLMFSSLLIGLFIVQRIRLKRRYNKLKQKLDVSLAQMSTASPKTTRKELFELDATQIERIAKGLDAFEKSKGYLDTTLSLKSLATAIDTNSSYLSKYVNAVKGVNFSNYISTLRIEYIMAELRVNARMRSYTIDAISEEAGFANARSFSNHFKRVTGINPSYFLKQLQKEMTTTEVVRPQTV